MRIELKVPAVGESITEVEVGDWKKAKGDSVQRDEPLVVLESEKATVDLPSPVAGVLTEILKEKGVTARVGEVIAYLDEAAPTGPAQASPSAEPAPSPVSPSLSPPRVTPAAQRVLAEHGLQAEQVRPTGPGGRLLKEDVLRHLEPASPNAETAGGVKATAPAPAKTAQAATTEIQVPPPSSPVGTREEQVIPLTRLRRTVAERLVQAQQNAALLTTFNEIDMSAVMALRKDFADAFQTKFGTKLGFMSFFVKASIDALSLIPQVNAEIRGHEIVYHQYCDIGVAIGGGKGLVVPVLRNAERMSFAQIELAITDFAHRAKESRLKPDELQGGTFTISNGGVYGSLLSTPIVNPPQSGVLGMHAIQERPVAREGQVVIRPMMYVALTYDHRLIDGREAVTFLRRIKEVLENPARLLLEV
ncbi:MAG: 2-oxoglutarate dehydrogenase complex dihydrolipoyllysine-residue succinyltransferase [Verrucomicrobiota bacterium]